MVELHDNLKQGWSREKVSHYLFLFGIFLLAGSLAWSKMLMSNAQIILLVSWLISGNLKYKLKAFVKNRAALVLSSVFLMHAIGLSYTIDFSYGMEDVRKKIPLLLMPLIFSTMPPLPKLIFERLLSFFVFSIVAATFVCTCVLLGFTHRQIIFPQQASIFISHVRFGLLISLSVFIMVYFFKEKKNRILRSGMVAVIIWLIVFLIMMESMTGLVCIGVVSAVLILYAVFRIAKTSVRISLIGIITLACVLAVIFIFKGNGEEKNIEKKSIKLATKNGAPYFTDTASKEFENGYAVWQNVCENELKSEWNKKSKIDYNGIDLNGNGIKYTLIRFLASKGLAKDSEAVNGLSEKEIKAIEKGIPNVNYMGVFNPTARIHKIIWEFALYMKGGNPSGHSVIQRFEFWKASIGIIKENFLLGVGTGDVEMAFKDEYEKINSPLTQEYRLRSHNQFLAMGVAFGLVGMFWFLFSLFYPIVREKKFSDYFYMVFFIIAFLSMFTEDTLETQAGVTFFAFFNSLFLFLRKKRVTF